MKFELPEKHGISEKILSSPIIYRGDDGEVSLTDAQYGGIEHGVARGESILLIAPTSSGKTEVGLLAVASWLAGGDGFSQKAVFLVSHRALARQKFKELRGQNYLDAFGLDLTDIVMSNGDMTIDGNEAVPEYPLNARLLIATYEKFLALLAGSGHRQDMSHYCVVADEFQLIANETRGQDIEILFTLIKTAGYGQFVGLSAVLNEVDTRNLANWMEVTSVETPSREVPLNFELRTADTTYSWKTDGPEEVQESPPSATHETLEILKELAKHPEENFPVAVFCMTKKRIKALTDGWKQYLGVPDDAQESMLELFDEGTAMAEALAIYIPNGFGLHTADLIDTERALVEDRLDKNELPVVFATTTLAQGLNYSFKTVIFDHWCRWNFQRRQDEPIPRSEFHNIAGRAGRLGMQEYGRVIFSAKDQRYTRAAINYLTDNVETQVIGRINPALFGLVTLQLTSSGIANNTNQLLDFLKNSLSGYLERETTKDFDQYWQEILEREIQKLRHWEFLS